MQTVNIFLISLCVFYCWHRRRFGRFFSTYINCQDKTRYYTYGIKIKSAITGTKIWSYIYLLLCTYPHWEYVVHPYLDTGTKAIPVLTGIEWAAEWPVQWCTGARSGRWHGDSTVTECQEVQRISWRTHQHAHWWWLLTWCSTARKQIKIFLWMMLLHITSYSAFFYLYSSK